MDKRIVIMAGGTGGHVYPALAVALCLQKDNWQVTWLGTRVGIESRVVPENNIEMDFVSVTGIRGKDFRGRLAVPVQRATSRSGHVVKIYVAGVWDTQTAQT